MLTPKNRWGILCPGPTLTSYETKRRIVRDGPEALVAVNGAIEYDLVADYWAVCDLEVLLTAFMRSQAGSDLHLPEKTVLWCPERWDGDIEATAPVRAYYDCFKKETFLSAPAEAFAEQMPFGKYIAWREATLFIAIGMAIKRGASDIRVYGAGMRGEGYYREGYENVRTRHTANRWEAERYWFERIVATCATQGILLHREDV